MANEERFMASPSVSLLLTHGRSNRLFLTRHKDGWGLIAGGVRKGETMWRAAVREAWEEANLKEENIIFVRGRNDFLPHPMFVNREYKDSLGWVFDTTYSGPKVPMDGWNIEGDSVDRVELFTWQRVLNLLDGEEKIYRPDFNYPQLIRWMLKKDKNTKIDGWLETRHSQIPGLSRGDSGRWDYVPPYYDWMGLPDIRGKKERTNFARDRFSARMK